MPTTAPYRRSNFDRAQIKKVFNNILIRLDMVLSTADVAATIISVARALGIDANMFIVDDLISEELRRILGLMQDIYSALKTSDRFALSTRNQKNWMRELALWIKLKARCVRRRKSTIST